MVFKLVKRKHNQLYLTSVKSEDSTLHLQHNANENGKYDQTKTCSKSNVWLHISSPASCYLTAQSVSQLSGSVPDHVSVCVSGCACVGPNWRKSLERAPLSTRLIIRWATVQHSHSVLPCSSILMSLSPFPIPSPTPPALSQPTPLLRQHSLQRAHPPPSAFHVKRCLI